MTKKIILALLPILVISIVGKSQEVSKTDSTSQTIPYRSEVGINISPAVSIILGSFPAIVKFSGSFKRIVKEKNALRFSANYIIGWNDNSFWYNHNNYEIISQTDSTQLRRYTQSRYGGRGQGNVGYEWRKGRRKLKYFFGTDIILGHIRNTERIYDQAYRLQRWGGWDSLYYLSPDYNIPTADIRSETSNSYYAGTAPFIGLTITLSKHFLLSAQAGFDIYYSFTDKNVTDSIKKTTHHSFSNSLDLNSTGIINDFSLVYRF